MKTWLLALAAITATVPAFAPADATLLQYVLSGPDQVTFYLDSQPTPLTSDDLPIQKNFRFEGVKGTLALEGRTVNVNYNVSFYGAVNGGAIDLVTSDYDPEFGWEDNGYLYLATDLVRDGAYTQLFKGPVGTPTLLTGSFNLIDTFDFLGYTNTYTLTVGEVATAVPEPATWLSMILGFGMLGALIRQRRKRGGVAHF